MVPVFGKSHFQGNRLNILQIGLGTCRTFLQNLTDWEQEDEGVTWLMDSASNKSRTLLGVGVEPVPEHVEWLRQALQHLPNTSLVQAAIGKRSQEVTVYTITPEQYAECLKSADPAEEDAVKRSVLYLRNMSSVGQVHPDFDWPTRDSRYSCLSPSHNGPDHCLRGYIK